MRQSIDQAKAASQPPPRRSVAGRYTAALLLAILAAMVRWLLDPYMGDEFPFITFFGAVSLSAFAGGSRPALLCTAASALLAWYFFLPPRLSFALAESKHGFGLATFVVFAAAIAGFAGLIQRKARRAIVQSRAAGQRETGMARELAAMTRLQRLSTRVYRHEDFSALLLEVLDAAIDLGVAEMAAVQVFGPALAQPAVVASRGLDQGVLEALRTEAPECGSDRAAPRSPDRTIITDLAADPASHHSAALQAAGRAGVRSLISTPLLSRSGECLGALNTYYHAPHAGDDAFELRILDLLARQAADWIEHSQAARTARGAMESSARLAAIVESSDDAIISKDLNGIVKSWNAGAERIFGYSAAEMIGQPITTIIPPDRQDEEPRILARLGRGERVDHYETVRRRKDGTLIDVSLTISPVHGAGGRVIGASKIARDISESVRIQTERAHLLESERVARTEAERATRLRDEFLAVVSHELRTPLNGILGWSQLLRRHAVDFPQINEAVAAIQRGARAQAQLIDDLLDMNRIMAGKLRLDISSVNLPQVIQAALETMRPAAEARDISLEVTLDTYDGTIKGDPARLQQVVWNLVSNAVKFTPKGGRVQVLLERVNSHVELSVADTGTGIAPEFLPHVFQRFTQADLSTTRRHGGLGLGLAIVRQIVELHGGTVSAESQGPGHGATFHVRLPISIVRRPGGEEPPQALIVAPESSVAFDGVRVLVVDDDAGAAEIVKRLLEAQKAEVLTVNSGAEAIETQAHFAPHLILSDIGMPEMDGYELIRTLRSSGVSTPAIAVTAFARTEDRIRSLQSGYSMHLSKPIESSELLTVVQAVLRNAGARSN